MMLFQSARIKLTAWYLTIIMLISLSFSLIIYTSFNRELKRSFRQVEMRFRAEELGLPAFPRQRPRNGQEISQQLIEDLQNTKKRVALNLLIINGAILAVSATAGWFLAGKTLQPIEKAMAEQKRFVADASHELRTPLTALKTSIEVALRDKKISLKKAKKILKSSLKDIDELKSLTNNLLSLTFYQSGNNTPLFQPINIREIIKTAQEKISPLAKKKKIKLTIKSKKQIIEADKQSLEKMLIIFLDNALKYTPRDGKIWLTTKSNKKKLIIKIKDNGIGIAKKDLPFIFDRFYRVDQSRSKLNVPGFGLGLSLAKKIINLHQGSVKTTSLLNKGTTFTIKLPLKHR